jgi:hypothetical protein
VGSNKGQPGDLGRLADASPVPLKFQDDFACSCRGMVDAKGKGPLDTYFVNGPLNVVKTKERRS